jgi:hypothetical protein
VCYLTFAFVRVYFRADGSRPVRHMESGAELFYQVRRVSVMVNRSSSPGSRPCYRCARTTRSVKRSPRGAVIWSNGGATRIFVPGLRTAELGLHPTGVRRLRTSWPVRGKIVGVPAPRPTCGGHLTTRSGTAANALHRSPWRFGRTPIGGEEVSALAAIASRCRALVCADCAPLQ